MLQINEGLAQEIIHEVGATRTLLLETLPNFVKEWANWKTISGLIRRMKSILAKVRNKINDLLNSLGEKPAEVKSGPGPDEKVQRNPDIFGGRKRAANRTCNRRDSNRRYAGTQKSFGEIAWAD